MEKSIFFIQRPPTPNVKKLIQRPCPLKRYNTVFSRQLLEFRNPYSISLADNSGKSGKRVYRDYDLKKETYGKRWAVVQRMTQTETD